MTDLPAGDTQTKSAKRTGAPRLFARHVAIDRIRGRLIASGWVENAPPGAKVSATLEDEPAPARLVALSKPAEANPRTWSLVCPIPRHLGLDALATLRLELGDEILDESAFALRLALDGSDPMIAVSRIVADPAAEKIRATGWAYAPGGDETVEILLDGRVVGSGPLTMKRPDLAVSRPLLGRSGLGWAIDAATPGLAERLAREPKPMVEARLALARAGTSFRVAELEFDGDLAAATRRRDRIAKAKQWVARAPTPLLDGLVASRAFRRRWAADSAGEAYAARRMVVDELIARGAASGERIMCLSNGLQVRADPGLDRVMARAFLLNGAYERGFLEWVASIVKPGDVAIDVGVAYGVVSLTLAKNGAQVFAVEANPAMVKAAQANCELNGVESVTIINNAASDRAGSLTFASAGPHNVGSSKLIPDGGETERMRFLEEINGLGTIALGAGAGPERAYAMDDLVIETVVAVTLDELCEARKLRDVAFVKIDIEGAELLALRGAKRLLDGGFGSPPIVALEFSRLVPVMGGTPEDIFEEFTRRGWRVHVQEKGKGRGGPLVPLASAADAPNHDNIICLPPGRVV